VIEVDFGAKSATSLDIVEAEITEHINLNFIAIRKRDDPPRLAFDGAAPPISRATRSISIRRTIRARSASCSSRPVLPPTTRCGAELIKSRDITTLSLKTVDAYAAGTGHQYVKALIAGGEARGWIAGRQLIDLSGRSPSP